MRRYMNISASLKRFVFLHIILLFLLSNSGCIKYQHYDYSDLSSQIDAIHYIEITAIDFSDKSLQFEYKIFETIDADKKDAILYDLSELDYRVIPEPHRLEIGDRGLLVTFKETSSDLHYVMYRRDIVSEWHRVETGDVYVWNYGATDTDNWNSLLDKYLKQEYSFDKYSR